MSTEEIIHDNLNNLENTLTEHKKAQSVEGIDNREYRDNPTGDQSSDHPVDPSERLSLTINYDETEANGDDGHDVNHDSGGDSVAVAEIKIEAEILSESESNDDSGDSDFTINGQTNNSSAAKSKRRKSSNHRTLNLIKFGLREDSLQELGKLEPTGKQVLERFLFLRKIHKETSQSSSRIVTKELVSLWSSVHPLQEISERTIKKKVDALIRMYKNYIKLRSSSAGNPSVDRFTKLIREKMSLFSGGFNVKKEESKFELDSNNPSLNCQPKVENDDLSLFLPPVRRSSRKLPSRSIGRTLDFYDNEIGELKDPAHPTPAEFAAALLRELVHHLERGHPLIEKVRLGSLLLHLVNKADSFDLLYRFYEEVESEVNEGNTEWTDQTFFTDTAARIIDTVNNIHNGDIQDNLKAKEADFLETIPSDLATAVLGIGDDDEEVTEDKPTRREDSDFEPFDNFTETEVEEKPKPKSKRGRKKKRDNPNYDSEEDRRSRKTRKYEYPCNQCDVIFKSVRKLDIHLFDEHSFGSLCSQCGHQSETYTEYESHMETHYIQCDICQIPVHGLKGLRNHNNRYHKTAGARERDRADTMCYICGKKLRKNYLQLHVRNVHESETVQCDKCEFSTNTREKLRIHMRRTHLNTLKTCPVCKKQVRMLKRHWEVTKCGGKVTTGIFTCDICNKQMSTAIGLKKHKKVIHMKAKDKQCQLCSYATYSTFNLRLHVTKVHTKENMETNCSICHAKTYSIDWHMKTYHNDVPWQPLQ